MQMQKPLDPCAQYLLDDLGRICPTYQMGWAKIPWKDEPTFDDAIAKIAASPVTKENFFIGITNDDWLDLRSKKYLNIEDGFYLATGVNSESSVFRFEFREEVFFSMRPDFLFLSLVTGCNEEPINKLESLVRDWLIDFYQETKAISRAIAANEIDPLELYPIETWLAFWESRGITVEKDSSTTPSSEKTLTETERNTMLKLIIGMAMDAYDYNPKITRNSATGDKNGIKARLALKGISIDDDTIRKYLKEAKELI